mmetsp:Transcript_2164/g.5084  ORF Transcript_2164/g.5084 Transcript_2164/m.5084 type:complete len:580 (-) Transcript_2164:90-1829(-)
MHMQMQHPMGYGPPQPPAQNAQQAMARSPTFFVGADRQKQNLAEFIRREQQLAEAYHENKPLCFNARAFQKTHPAKVSAGHTDADVTLTAPLMLGVADGVSQIEDFGIDASMLPKELLKVCEDLGRRQLLPDENTPEEDLYKGPLPLLKKAFQSTKSLGSLTIVLAVMDNSTRIHGKAHPMIAIITVGDCELLILRRIQGKRSRLEAVCHTEMQRIDGHAQTPLQLARVDARIDENFTDSITIEVIEHGSAVHCVSAYEGDIVVLGSDGVFDNLFLDEIAALCNSHLPPGTPSPVPEHILDRLTTAIVESCHAKTNLTPNGYADAPIGLGGKKDDTSVVVGEVVEFTQAMRKQFGAPRRAPRASQRSRSASRNIDQWRNIWAHLNFFAEPMDSCCAAMGYESPQEDEESYDVPVGLPNKVSPESPKETSPSHIAHEAAHHMNQFPAPPLGPTLQQPPGTQQQPSYTGFPMQIQMQQQQQQQPQHQQQQQQQQQYQQQQQHQHMAMPMQMQRPMTQGYPGMAPVTQYPQAHVQQMGTGMQTPHYHQYGGVSMAPPQQNPAFGGQMTVPATWHQANPRPFY